MSPIFYIVLIIGLVAIFSKLTIKQLKHSRHRKRTDEQIIRGEHDQAIQNLQAILKHDPDDLPALFGLAKLQVKAGRAVDAISVLKGLLDKNLQGSGVSQIETLLLLVDAFEASGNSDEAYKHILIARGLDQTNPEVNLKLGAYEYQKGNFQEAFSYSGMVLRLNPTHQKALLQRGMAAFRLGNTETATEVLRKLLQLDGTNYEAAYNLTLIYAKFGNIQECASFGDLAKRLARTNEQRAQINFTIGTAYFAAKNNGKALERLEETLKETADNEMRKKTLLLMMTITESQKDINRTLTIITQYLKFDPDNPSVQSKQSYYQELVSNQGLQKYEMLPISQFSEFCRDICKAVVRVDLIQHIETNNDGSVDILATKTTKTEHFIYQFRFIRSNNPIGEMFVRDLYAKMRANSGEKAFVISNTSYTEGAKNFSSTRVVSLIGKDQLIKLLKKVSG